MPFHGAVCPFRVAPAAHNRNLGMPDVAECAAAAATRNVGRKRGERGGVGRNRWEAVLGPGVGRRLLCWQSRPSGRYGCQCGWRLCRSVCGGCGRCLGGVWVAPAWQSGCQCVGRADAHRRQAKTNATRTGKPGVAAASHPAPNRSRLGRPKRQPA